MNPIKAATTFKPFKGIKNKKQISNSKQINLPYKNTIPEKPQYHPLGSSEIPGSAVIQQAPINLSKSASVGTAINEALTPLNLGLGAMNVASGTNSVGGEIVGQLGFNLGTKAIKPLSDRIYNKDLHSNAKFKLARRLGSGGLRFISGILGYGLGSHLANNTIPLYKRASITTKVKDAVTNLFGKSYRQGDIKNSMLNKYHANELDSSHVLRTDIQGNPYIRKLNILENKMKNILPGGDADVQKYTNLATYSTGIGGGIYLGNNIYKSDKIQNNEANNMIYYNNEYPLLVKQAALLPIVKTVTDKIVPTLKNTFSGVKNTTKRIVGTPTDTNPMQFNSLRKTYADFRTNGWAGMANGSRNTIKGLGVGSAGMTGAYMLGRGTRNNNVQTNAQYY